MTGQEQYDAATEMNGGVTINETLFYQLLNVAKNNRESKRAWRTLVSLDTSLTASPSSTYQTTYALPTRWLRFVPYRPASAINEAVSPIQLVSGTEVVHLEEIQFERRVTQQSVGYKFAVDPANSVFYITGTIPKTYTINQLYIKGTADITSSTSWTFPTRFHLLPVLDVIAMFKGGIDADDQNARMAPELRAAANAIRVAMETWDNDLALSAIGQ